MANLISWKKTLGAKLGALTVVQLAMTLLLVLAGLYMLGKARGEAGWIYSITGIRPPLMRALLLANRIADAGEPGEKKRLRSRLDELVRELDLRDSSLRRDDPAGGISGATDSRTVETQRILSDSWRKDIRPILTDRLDANTTRDAAAEDLARLEGAVNAQIARFDDAIALGRQRMKEDLEGVAWLVIGYSGCLAALLLAKLWMIRGVYHRTRLVLGAADRMAGGDLAADVTVPGNDELA